MQFSYCDLTLHCMFEAEAWQMVEIKSSSKKEILLFKKIYLSACLWVLVLSYHNNNNRCILISVKENSCVILLQSWLKYCVKVFSIWENVSYKKCFCRQILVRYKASLVRQNKSVMFSKVIMSPSRTLKGTVFLLFIITKLLFLSEFFFCSNWCISFVRTIM